MKTALTGIVPVLPTPFDEREEIDEKSLRNVVNYAIDAGVAGICSPAYASEFYKLSESERMRVAEIVVDEAHGRVPVIISTGHGSTKLTIDFSRHAETIGADIVMVTVPKDVYLDARGLYSYYHQVGSAVRIPVMIQDSDFTGSGLAAEFILRLHESLPNVQYAKIETLLSGAKYSEILAANRGIKLLTGLNGLYMLDALERGVMGIMPGCAALDIYISIYELFQTGRRKEAKQRFNQILPYIVFSMQSIELVNAVEKKILKSKGILRTDVVRSPTIMLDQYYSKQIREYADEGLLKLTPMLDEHGCAAIPDGS